MDSWMGQDGARQLRTGDSSTKLYKRAAVPLVAQALGRRRGGVEPRVPLPSCVIIHHRLFVPSPPSRPVPLAPGQSTRTKVRRLPLLDSLALHRASAPARSPLARPPPPALPKRSCLCSDPFGRACAALSPSWVTQASWRCRCSVRSYCVPSCCGPGPVMEELRELRKFAAPCLLLEGT